MKKILSILSILGIIFITSSCGSSSESNTKAQKDWYKLFEKPWVISINYPNDWNVQEWFMWTIAAITSPLDDENDVFSENINFLTQDISELWVETFQEYLDINLDQISKFFNEYEVISQEEVELSGITGTKLVYTFKQGQYSIYSEQYYLDNEGTAVIVTISKPVDEKNAFTQEFTEMLHSLNVE